MTVVTETFTNAHNEPTGGGVTFAPCSLRSTTAGVLAPCPVWFPIDPVTGNLATPELEPGCYTVIVSLDCTGCVKNQPYDITLPASGSYTLWGLIAAQIPLPANTNPYVVSVGGLSGVITQQQIADMVGAFAAGSYVHTQNVASGVWTITHNLGQQLVDGTTVFSLDYQTQYQNVIVECLNPNQCRLFFADPVSGVALIQR